jgi:short-subunit dehydrogenase
MITCLITGATSGIGLSILKILVKKNIRILVIGRSEKKWELLKTRNPVIKKIKFIKADLSDIYFIKKIKFCFKDVKNIDIMINNAGLINDKLEINSVKQEKIYFTNFLSVFILIKILMPKILKSKSPLIINTSSFVSRFGKINLKDLQQKKNFSGWNSYKNSKLMLSILTNYYSHKFLNKVNFISWSPGYTKSNLGSKSGYVRKITFLIRQFIGQHPDKAANDLYYVLKTFNKSKYSGSFIFKKKIVLNNFFKRFKYEATKLNIIINKYV